MARINLLWLVFIAGCANFGADRDPTFRLKQAHAFGATVLAYNHDGGMLATGGFFGEVRTWQMPAGKARLQLPGNRETVRGIAWIDDDTLVAATEDGTLTAWDLRTQRPTQRITTMPLTAMAHIPQTAQLLVAHRDAILRVYVYPDLAMLAERKLGAAMRAIAVSRDGTTIAAATADDQLLLLDTRLQITRTLAPAPRNVLSLRFSPDGRQLAAGTWFKLLFWDIASGALTQRDTRHFGAIISIDYTPDGKELVSLGRISDSSLQLTDVTTGQVLGRMAPLPLCGWMVRFSPDGRYIAAGSESGDVDVFDLAAPPRK